MKTQEVGDKVDKVCQCGGGEKCKCRKKRDGRVARALDALREVVKAVGLGKSAAGDAGGFVRVPGVSKWHMSAGGTSAAEGKHGYSHHTEHGEYHIAPVTSERGRHRGYQLHFAHTKGTGNLPHGGLWHNLGLHASPQRAASRAAEHHGEISSKPHATKSVEMHGFTDGNSRHFLSGGTAEQPSHHYKTSTPGASAQHAVRAMKKQGWDHAGTTTSGQVHTVAMNSGSRSVTLHFHPHATKSMTGTSIHRMNAHKTGARVARAVGATLFSSYGSLEGDHAHHVLHSHEPEKTAKQIRSLLAKEGWKDAASKTAPATYVAARHPRSETLHEWDVDKPHAISKSSATSIGQTRSGKDIPHHGDSVYTEHVRQPKWNVKVSPLMDSDVGGRLLRQRLPCWSKDDHRDAAATHIRAAHDAQRKWGETADQAHRETFGKQRTPLDYRVSGVGREEYAGHHKDALRQFARDHSSHAGAAHAHWRAAGHHTRRMPDAVDHIPHATAKSVAKGYPGGSYSGDPRWIRAKYAGSCHGCKQPIKAGDHAFYYPRGKTMHCEKCGAEGAAALESEKQYERQFKSVAESVVSIDKKHPSYRAGARYGKHLAEATGILDPDRLIHVAAVKHTHGRTLTLEQKVGAQRHFKAGVRAHAGDDVFEHHRRRIEAADRRMPKELWGVMYTKALSRLSQLCDRMNSVS